MRGEEARRDSDAVLAICRARLALEGGGDPEGGAPDIPRPGLSLDRAQPLSHFRPTRDLLGAAARLRRPGAVKSVAKPARGPRMVSSPICVAALYQFAPFPDPPALRGPLLDLCESGRRQGHAAAGARGDQRHDCRRATRRSSGSIAHIRGLPGCAGLEVKYSRAATDAVPPHESAAQARDRDHGPARHRPAGERRHLCSARRTGTR